MSPRLAGPGHAPLGATPLGVCVVWVREPHNWFRIPPPLFSLCFPTTPSGAGLGAAPRWGAPKPPRRNRRPCFWARRHGSSQRRSPIANEGALAPGGANPTDGRARLWECKRWHRGRVRSLDVRRTAWPNARAVRSGMAGLEQEGARLLGRRRQGAPTVNQAASTGMDAAAAGLLMARTLGDNAAQFPGGRCEWRRRIKTSDSQRAGHKWQGGGGPFRQHAAVREAIPSQPQHRTRRRVRSTEVDRMQRGGGAWRSVLAEWRCSIQGEAPVWMEEARWSEAARC